MGIADLLTRSIRPPDPETPNSNPPGVAPASVGPPDAEGGDPHGVTMAATEPATTGPPPTIMPSAWSGWPADWYPPMWNGRFQSLSGTAWTCIDYNASVLAEMEPYLVGAAPGLDSSWLVNPDPDIYSSWEEFAKQLFWDFQLGEAFVYATAYYSTGWPARFRVLAPWLVEVEMDGGSRRYKLGSRVLAPTEILHLRYQSNIVDAHGHGPLEAGRARITAADTLARYLQALTSTIAPSLLEAPEEMSPDQAETLRDDWVTQRMANPGIPAVLSGGLKWTPTQLSPRDMALLELQQFTESRIAVMLGVPPALVGLPSGEGSLTYASARMYADQHWRMGLRPKAKPVMRGLSGWALPRGTYVEVNQDAYVQPEPKERAETAKILNSIVDADGNPALSVEEIRRAERLDEATPQGGPIG